MVSSRVWVEPGTSGLVTSPLTGSVTNARSERVERSQLNEGAKPTKNQRRSLMMGPPTSAPKSTVFSSLGLAALETMADAALGMSLGLPVSAPGLQLPQTMPWNSLEPDLVTTLSTPPVARPYSAM